MPHSMDFMDPHPPKGNKEKCRKRADVELKYFLGIPPPPSLRNPPTTTGWDFGEGEWVFGNCLPTPPRGYEWVGFFFVKGGA